MLNYPELNHRWTNPALQARVPEYLIDVWLDDYLRALGTAKTNLVITSNTGFSYLFDIEQQRLVAAWGYSQGKHEGERDHSRMRQHPLSAGKKYHRGHAIAHTLGGGLDINLVAQNGLINVGAFRALEKKAVATPGALYFTYWEYSTTNSQTPTSVQQGLLCPGAKATIARHIN